MMLISLQMYAVTASVDAQEEKVVDVKWNNIFGNS